MPGSKRPERVGELIRAELSAMIRSDLHDPAIGFVTITQVQMSHDLHTARIYFSCLGGPEDFDKVRDGFDRAAGYLRREIGHRCRLRYAPELHFFPDRSAETGARIEQILRESLPAEDGSRSDAEDVSHIDAEDASRIDAEERPEEPPEPRDADSGGPSRE
jgi:ribosome-binding factor A